MKFGLTGVVTLGTSEPTATNGMNGIDSQYGVPLAAEKRLRQILPTVLLIKPHVHARTVRRQSFDGGQSTDVVGRFFQRTLVVPDDA